MPQLLLLLAAVAVLSACRARDPGGAPPGSQSTKAGVRLLADSATSAVRRRDSLAVVDCVRDEAERDGLQPLDDGRDIFGATVLRFIRALGPDSPRIVAVSVHVDPDSVRVGHGFPRPGTMKKNLRNSPTRLGARCQRARAEDQALSVSAPAPG